MKKTIKYPRRRLIRTGLKYTIKPLFQILTRPRLTGLENFPQKGPLILVGNHTGAMEVVTMTVFAPWTIEYIGASDIPFEPKIAVFVYAYGFIPIFRGNVSRDSLEAGLSILRQGGVLGIFPEGGIPEPTMRQTHSGVAWLSHHGKAPILPIGFGEMNGALGEIFNFKRPEMEMNVGELIPPVEIASGKSRKQQYQEAAEQIMSRVWELVPEDHRPAKNQVEDESFEFIVEITDQTGIPQDIPEALAITAGASLSLFLHGWLPFSTVQYELAMPVVALRNLSDNPPLEEILTGTNSILAYLDNDNPYFFTFRYGQQKGASIRQGIEEFQALVKWAQDNDYNMAARAIRRYRKPDTSEEVVLDRVEVNWQW
jgi:1-acyl-sn-glycerol-3-phosphate acyltransferase